MLEQIIRSSKEASVYSLSVISKLFKPFNRYRGNDIWPDERTDGRTGQSKNITSLPTLINDEGIIQHHLLDNRSVSKILKSSILNIQNHVCSSLLPTDVMLFIRVVIMCICRRNVAQITTYCLSCLPWCRCRYSINLLTGIAGQLTQLWCSRMCSRATKLHHFSYRYWREVFGRFVCSSSSSSTAGCKIFIIIRLETKIIRLAVLAFVQKATAKKRLLHHTQQNHFPALILY